MAQAQTPTKRTSSGVPLAGGIIGAVVGAAVGSYFIYLLKDKHNREKVMRVFEDVKDKTIKALKEVNEQPNGIENVAKETLEENIDKVSKKYLN